MRTPRDPFWRPLLAGLAAVGVVPVVALLIALDDGGSRGRDLEAHALAVTDDSSDLESLHSARRIARTRLRAAVRSLRRCDGDCARWPLARLAIDGRVAGGILYGVAASDGLADCRPQTMGEANGLRVLGGQADEIIDRLADASRAETARAIRATRAMVRDLLRQLRRPACARAASRGR